MWYWRSDKGDYEFYDSAGFHPHTGEPLGVLTREIIGKREEELLLRKREEQKKAKADQRRICNALILISTHRSICSPVLRWYWRSDKGDYEFFDSAGFHPSTGEPLSALTREAIKKREEELQQRAEQEEQERRKREDEQEASRARTAGAAQPRR